MAYSETRANQLLPLLDTLGTIRTKKMFGALAIYSDDVLFAAVMDDEFCLRVKDGTLAKEFETQGYCRHEIVGRDMKIPYFDIPSAVISDKKQLIALSKRVIKSIKNK